MTGELHDAKERLRVLEAILGALDEPHAALDLVLEAQDPDAASRALQEHFGLDAIQAMAILDMQYRRLTMRDRERIRDDIDDLRKHIESLSG